MTDSMKFGPEWLRNMKSDTSLGAGTTPITPAPIKMAEFRYGREEMLALFDRSVLPPDPLRQMQGLFVDKIQLPLALVQMTEDETRMWNRGINSDGALRPHRSQPGPGVGVPGGRGALGGRGGGSVDRGRGRARGSYHYSRGLSYEESETSNGYNNRNVRSYDRTQSQGSWGERNGGDPGDYMATSPRKEFGTRGLTDTNWRRHRGAGEEDEGWRANRTEKWGRGGSNSWRDGDSNWDRNRPWEEGNNNSQPTSRKPWENEENNLPEWAMENPSESGGSFDASGAFHGGTVYSDEEDSEANPNSQRALSRTEHSKSNSSQPRPAPHSKKEPPNITNGSSNAQTDNAGSESVKSRGPLRQSQSATNLPSEHRPAITLSASYSGVNSHTLHTSSEGKPQREENLSKPAASPPRQTPTNNVKPPEVEQPEVKPSQEEDIEQRLMDAADVFVSRLMDEEEREPPSVPTTTNSSPPTPAASHNHKLKDSLWYYQDPQGNVQGPFQSSEMAEWFNSGYFKGNLLVRRACDERYSPLSELIKLWNGVPFMLDYFLVPPIKNSEAVLPVPVLEETLYLQLQHQQRLAMQRLVLSKLSQQDHFNSLTLEEQQVLLQALAHQAQLDLNLQAGLMAPHTHTAAHTNTNVVAMLQQLAHMQQLHQQHQRPGAQQVAVTTPTEQVPLVDPVHQLIQQMGLQRPVVAPPQTTPEDQRSFEQFMNAFRQRKVNSQPPPPPQPVAMESVWGVPPAFPAWSVPPGQPAPPPQSLWAEPITKGVKTEKEILEEQLRAQEEKKKEELRKQEELQRLKEEEEMKEKERQKRIKEEEELERKRKEEEEKEKEKERKRLQEEEDRRKKEAAAAKKAEQDRLRKEEEKKRKEEEKRRKEEEKRKQEEEKKKAEEDKKKLEEERKKREEMTKRQNEALKRLQEQQQQARAVKPTPAPWTAPETAGASLADIQKTERKQQQQLREQQEMLKAFQEKHQQEQQQQLKNSKSGSSLNLKWAESTKNQPARVKSLAEIQAEEHEQMAKQAEKEKAERLAAVKEVSLAATGSIWATANQSLTWNSNTASVWGTTPVTNSAVSGARFFDEKPSKPVSQPTVTKSQAKTKSKKEEASVMKLFEKNMPTTSKSEEFYKWCNKTLSAFSYNLDVPTFVDFLLGIESHVEVREYVRMYMGETKEGNDFASEFIERRTRLKSADQSNHRPEPAPPTAQNNHFQEVKGKNKKVKKSKMTKVDNRILGFNVTAAPDRINVGDRDYVEGL